MHPRITRAFEGAPWVSVSVTSDPHLSALLADKYCGGDAELIYYLTPGTLLSRTFSSKDTHSPRGDLLVVYSEGRGADRATLASARATSALLAFEAPVFTYGTDLILPSYVNDELAKAIGADADDGRGEGVLAVAAEFENMNAAEVRCFFLFLVVIFYCGWRFLRLLAGESITFVNGRAGSRRRSIRYTCYFLSSHAEYRHVILHIHPNVPFHVLCRAFFS